MEAARLRIKQRTDASNISGPFRGPAFYSSTLDLAFGRLPFHGLWHLTFEEMPMCEYVFRSPAEPSPPPIQDPIDPPENPDAPVREPDPEEPGQI